ncbi:MAG: acetolactate synthase large subunit [Polyangiaceae bacterium]|nr:acetolactate synthase large subunit [Polyangiaceae bacterium]
MKAAELFVQALVAEGVECIFALPGEENLDLLEAIRRAGLRVVLTRHEQPAGFMAATHGRLTGKAGVCLATLGPGATNLVTAAAYAQLGAMPMLMITGQKPIKTSKQGHFQIVDVVDMMRPLTKYTRQIVTAASIPSRVREAIRVAEEERPGATHLELPEDIARDETDAQLLPLTATRRPVADDKAITRALHAIASSRRPLLMVGAGANRKLTSKMLRQFVEKTGIPFFSTQMGKGVLDETHPLWLGNAALSTGDFVHRAIDVSDCVINVGHDVVEKPPFFMHAGSERTVIHVGFMSAGVDAVYFPQIEVVGDIANSIWRLKEALDRKATWDFAFFDRVRAALDLHLKKYEHDASFPVRPSRLVAEVRRALPDDGILALDNGLYKLWFARQYRARERNTVLLDNALGTMGAGLPSAMAVHLVHPQRKVLAVVGDGGFMMNSQELETAVRLNMNLTVLVLRDDAYGMIRWKQRSMELPDYGMSFGNPDFVRYAEAYGAHGHRPESVPALATSLRECLDSPGVHLIDVAVDYSDDHRILNEEIRELSGAL